MAPKAYNVLALDGGGIRGVIPARVLQVIEERSGQAVADLFDLVAGTSTGGIIALGLTMPDANGRPAHSATQMLDFYLQQGATIFPDSRLHKLETLGGIGGVRFSAEPLEKLLDAQFGNTPLSQALVEIVVPSYDLTVPGPFFFKREYARSTAHDWDVPMARVARATSAAPTYFNPAEVAQLEKEGDHALVDGGTFSNNPALAAYVDALRMWGGDADILVVSVGTGQPPQTPGSGEIPMAPNSANDWGEARWARPILQVVLDGSAKAVEYQMSQLAAQSGATMHYHRLQSALPTASHAMDDASPGNRNRLLADANSLIAEHSGEIDSICAALLERRRAS